MIRFGQPGVLINDPWESLSASDRKSEARIMEIFAGMLTNLDGNLGKLFGYLKDIGEYDNTLVLLLSDNGADGMGYGFIPYVDTADPTSGLTIDNSFENLWAAQLVPVPQHALGRSRQRAIPAIQGLYRRGRASACRPSRGCRRKIRRGAERCIIVAA